MQKISVDSYISSAQVSVEKLAFFDHLTGARNFPKFMLDAQRLLRKFPHKKYAFWSYDIKQFHIINTTFGGEAGDSILKQVSLLFKMFEETDNAFCRNLSDQFLGIRPYAVKDDLIAWFYSFRERLDEKRILFKKHLALDYAMGFYCIEDFEDVPPVRDMINYTMEAKKAAKRQAGIQFYFFSPELKQKIIREATLNKDKNPAFSSGEISFVVQPKVAIEPKFHIVGGEVLARWCHPFYGWVSPGEFIPLFEEDGFIIKLDRYIFNQACAWYSQNCTQGITLSNLAINVSRQGFLQDDFVEYYSSIKQAYGIADNVLELEITENILLEDYEPFRKTIVEMQARGFLCTIDDLGSGYSSLIALKSLPINVLKLDACFFQNGPGREKIIVAHLINMAKDLGIKTVAEGIEHLEQVDFLRQVGCDIIQGYIFSTPLQQEDFVELLMKDNGYITPVLPR